MLQGPVSKYLSKAQGSAKGTSGKKADLEAVGQAHISAVAGACLSIGIKFAGSADAAAEGVLRRYVLYFLKARQQAPDSASGDYKLVFCVVPWGKLGGKGGWRQPALRSCLRRPRCIALMFLGGRARSTTVKCLLVGGERESAPPGCISEGRGGCQGGRGGGRGEGEQAAPQHCNRAVRVGPCEAFCCVA